MRRFFLDRVLPEEAASVDLDGPDAHHLRDVLRARPGEPVGIVDAAGAEYDAEVESLDPSAVRLRLLARRAAGTEPPYEAILLQALAKGERMDLLVQKSVELGASRIVPFAGARSVVRLDAAEGRRKSERWSRVAEEAAKQCGRAWIPPVDPPVAFEAALRLAAAADVAFLPWEGERTTDLGELFREPAVRSALGACAREGRPPRIAFLIGPEGGFSDDEVAASVAAGLRSITLGRRILRTETAGPAVLAQLSLLLETGGGLRP